jgi:hypothetical protein
MTTNDLPALPTNPEEAELYEIPMNDALEQSLANADLDHMEQMAPEDDDNEQDQFLTDAEADGDALASCGFGTDEDYCHETDCGGDW